MIDDDEIRELGRDTLVVMRVALVVLLVVTTAATGIVSLLLP